MAAARTRSRPCCRGIGALARTISACMLPSATAELIPLRRSSARKTLKNALQAQTKAAAPFDTAARTRRTKGDLVQVVRHVVERRVQLVADALHRANRRNGDQSSDETVFNRGRTLFIANQLEKLAHGLAPWFQVPRRSTPQPAVHWQDGCKLEGDRLRKSYARRFTRVNRENGYFQPIF